MKDISKFLTNAIKTKTTGAGITITITVDKTLLVRTGAALQNKIHETTGQMVDLETAKEIVQHVLKHLKME